MSTQTYSAEEVVDKIVEWVEFLLPEVRGNAYDYLPSEKKKALPDVVVDIIGSRVATSEDAFPFYELQQINLLVYEVSVSIMVDNSNPESAAELLRSFQDGLMVGVLESGTLGGRVPVRSPYVRFGYTPPLTEYEDGTIGRELTLQINVAGPVQIVE